MCCISQLWVTSHCLYYDYLYYQVNFKISWYCSSLNVSDFVRLQEKWTSFGVTKFIVNFMRCYITWESLTCLDNLDYLTWRWEVSHTWYIHYKTGILVGTNWASELSSCVHSLFSSSHCEHNMRKCSKLLLLWHLLQHEGWYLELWPN